MNETAVYENSVIAKLTAPNPRSPEKDATARAKRQARTEDLKQLREQATREAERLSGTTETEKDQFQKLEEKYEAVFLNPDKTNEAFHLKCEAQVHQDRIERLQANAAKLQQELQAIGVELDQIAATEKQETENEQICGALAESGREAAVAINAICQALSRLREIAVKLHYEMPTTCSPANGEQCRRVCDDIVNSFRILVFKRTFYQDLRDESQFLRMLRAEKWPSF